MKLFNTSYAAGTFSAGKSIVMETKTPTQRAYILDRRDGHKHMNT
jgi:hypothetical protein